AWKLQVQAPATPAESPRRLLWAEHHIFRQESGWRHQGSYLIVSRTAGDQQLILPEGAELLAVSWGEHILHPRQDDAQHMTLQLTQEPAGKVLQVRWHYPKGEPRPAARAMAIPRLQEMDEPSYATTLWLGDQQRSPALPQMSSEPLLQRAQAQ